MLVNFLDYTDDGRRSAMPFMEIAERYQVGADSYARSHERWLRHEGGEAQCAFEGAVAALLKPETSMLDAACGTGTMVRRLLQDMNGRGDVTLLDAAPGMLRMARGIPARRVLGRIEAMPFASCQFDLVSCAWGIETLVDPTPAVSELIRVTRPGGHLCLVFCSNLPARSIIGAGMRRQIARKGLGRFLEHTEISLLAAALGISRVRTLHCSGAATAMILYR